MKSASSQQYTSIPSLSNHHNHSQQQTSIDAETSTYSFRYVTKKLQHAKSYGELYQPNTPLPLPPMIPITNHENERNEQQKYPSDSPQSITSVRARASTTTALPYSTNDEKLHSSSSNKIPLWKRVKNIIPSKKRNKEQQHSTIKISNTQSNELSTNRISEIFHR